MEWNLHYIRWMGLGFKNKKTYNRVRWITSFVIILSIGPSLLTFAGDPIVAPPFNEIYDENGNLRGAYQQIQEHWDVANPTWQTTQRLAHLPLYDRRTIYPVPLVLKQDEIQFLQKAGEQRARALHAFFCDMVLGAQSATDDTTGFIPKKLFAQILAEENLSGEYLRGVYKGKRPEDIWAQSGTDFVRNEEGQWVALEDNFGKLGGPASVDDIHHVYFSEKNPSWKPAELNRLVSTIMSKAGIRDPKAEVYAILSESKSTELPDPKRFEADLQDLKWKELLGQREIHIKSPATIIASAEQAAAAPKSAKLVMNIDNPLSPTARLLLDHDYTLGKIKLFRAPYTDLLGNKALLPFVEKMIINYLGETPMVQTQPTQLVRNLPLSLVTNPPQLALKYGTGARGDRVFLLPRMTKRERNILMTDALELAATAKITGGPLPTLVSQDYVEPSYLGPPNSPPVYWNSINVRPIVYAFGPKDVHSYKYIWGRVKSFLGDGLNNVAKGASHLVIISPQSCIEALTDVSGPSVSKSPRQ